MRGVDTNILVYAYDASSPRQEVAAGLVKGLAEGSSPWGLPWPCVYEFLRVVTHPRIGGASLSVQSAWELLRPVLSSPNLLLLGETDRHVAVFEGLLRRTRISGNLVHDAHIAALLVEHGVREVLTADDDFRKFEALTVTNPFV